MLIQSFEQDLESIPIGLKADINPGEERFKGFKQSLDFIKYQAPTQGTLNNLVIFIRFNDQADFAKELTTYDEIYNGPDVSMNTYYLEASYSMLSIDTYFYPTSEGAYPTSYVDPNPRSYYERYDASLNPGGYLDDDEGRVREHTLLKNAVLEVASQVPVSLNLDGDGDGYVDNVSFFLRGSESGWSELLWPHMWVLWSFDPTYGDGSGNVKINGKTVWTYNFLLDDFSGDFGLGVLAHEMFHSLGAPDLYHYSHDGLNPVATWALMGYNANPPQHMSSYMKYRYGGWISNIPEISSPGEYSLQPLQSVTNNCYKVPSPNSTDEFFLLEYRKQEGDYESSLPGTGLLVYRINTTVDGAGNRDGPPDEVYLYRPNGTTINDGNYDIANFSSDVNRTSINDFTNPASFLTDGTFGALDVSNIESSGPTISFELNNSGSLGPDLTAGSNCDNWEIPLVLSSEAGEYTTEEFTEPFAPGDYFINSAIQNIGIDSAIFLDDQTVWQIFLDNALVSSHGWTTASDLLTLPLFRIEVEESKWGSKEISTRNQVSYNKWKEKK